MSFFSRSTPQPAAAEIGLAPGEPLISLNNLEKSYAHGTSRSWVLRRIALDIKGQDTTAEDPIWVHTCNAIATRHSVQFGGKFDSHLLLPVIPD